MHSTATPTVKIIGGGLAGSEAAWQLARLGLRVVVHEMKPKKFSAAHKLPGFAELVCSNSFGSTKLSTGSGLLKQELELLGSLILQLGKQHSVPAGGALGIERVGFSAAVTETLQQHPNITIVHEEVGEIDPEQPTIIATGPLTSDALAQGIGKLLGDKFLFFYDAVSPIIAADSLKMDEVSWASRYDDKEGDYLNIPLSRHAYYAFIEAIRTAQKVPLHPFEEPKYYEACLPMDVLAERGVETLAHGAMKPVGLEKLRCKDGSAPYAVIQLRRENFPTTMFSMVGCQNKLKWPEQERIFRTLPGLSEAKFARLGSVHRNTFIHSPSLLNPDLSLRAFPKVRFAGQVSGVEGYMESAATGLMAGLFCARQLLGQPLPALPEETILGALIHYLCNGSPVSKEFQPMNCNFSLLKPPAGIRGGRRRRSERREASAEDSKAAMNSWLESNNLLFDNSSTLHYYSPRKAEFANNIDEF